MEPALLIFVSNNGEIVVLFRFKMHSNSIEKSVGIYAHVQALTFFSKTGMKRSPYDAPPKDYEIVRWYFPVSDAPLLKRSFQMVKYADVTKLEEWMESGKTYDHKTIDFPNI